MGFASVGTDTGGSIRIPSALCGIVGLKPTFGLVSTAGVVTLAASFDHAGPIARSVTDACILLEAIAGKYPRGETRPDHRKLRRIRPRRFRIGLPKEFFFERLDAEVRRMVEAAAKKFESLGARVEQVSLPRLTGAIDQASLLVVAEINEYHESQGYYPAQRFGVWRRCPPAPGNRAQAAGRELSSRASEAARNRRGFSGGVSRG